MLESEEIESPNSSASFNRTVRGEGGGRAGSGFQASSRVAQASSCRLRASQVMGEDNPSGKRSGEDGASGNSVTPQKDMTTPNRAGAGEEIVAGARRQVSAILSTSSSSRGRNDQEAENRFHLGKEGATPKAAPTAAVVGPKRRRHHPMILTRPPRKFMELVRSRPGPCPSRRRGPQPMQVGPQFPFHRSAIILGSAFILQDRRWRQ